MTELLGVAILGLGLSALYALASLGLVLTYRGSGVVNFAQGAVGLCAAFIWFELHVGRGWAYLPSLAIAVLAAGVSGALIHLLLMRRLRNASWISRTVVTLGLLITLQAAVVLQYGTTVNSVPAVLPTDTWDVGGVAVPVDRIILMLIALVLTVVLWAAYRYTSFGRATSAVAEDQTLAAAVGISPDVIAAINWALASGLAALAAVLVAPVITLQAGSMTTLVIAALAAALIAGFQSFSIAFAASVCLGVGQTLLTRYVDQPGVAAAAPFIVMIAILTLRGRAIPLRDFVVAKQPTVGSGRVRPPIVVATVAVAVLAVLSLDQSWALSFGTTFAITIFMLSFVVLTGYVGQLSLAQWPLAGFGAWVAGRLMSAQDMSFLPAALIGIAATVAVGVLIALPAIRTRGVNLAIVTFGTGAALELMLFDNSNYTGGISGTSVQLELFGWNFDGGTHPHRYALVTLGAFVLVALMVTNLRRGLVGRRMLAVRTNERAAAALGISVVSVKLYGFAVSAGIAALGAILFSFSVGIVDYGQFSSFESVFYAGLAFLGGIGFVVGPLLGAPLAPNTVGTQFGIEVLTGLGPYLPLIGGIALILTILTNQDGVAAEAARSARHFGSVVRRLAKQPSHGLPTRIARLIEAKESPSEAGSGRRRSTLTVDNLSVRYGSVLALEGVNLEIKPGAVLGLIGPNGAGKTTLLDAVTGFAKATEGTVDLDGRHITSWSPTARARAGVSRAFQSLELFEDMTALENLIAATEPNSRACYLTDLVRPARLRLAPGVVDAIKQFRLEGDLLQRASELPYGRRRLLAIARAIASKPAVLLLDEPAAGLSGEETRELGRVIRRLADDWGMAVLLIEHDVEFVLGTCDEAVVLNFGRVISSGSPEVVRRDPAVIEAYLGGEAEPMEVALEGSSR